MEENVALDSSKQRKFVKSIKSIKKLIKKKDAVPEPEGTEKPKKERVTKRVRKERGLVYLSHIPHGFYEHEMTQYFKQFGVVTNARVVKSKRTGRSKGFAFVEFKEPAVAEIVAETMNNYLMGKRLIKAACIPKEKQKRAFRRHWNSVNNPGNTLRIKMKKAHNEEKDEQGELKRARQLLSNIRKTKKKLNELGINYDFFAPVDVPEALANSVDVKAEDSEHNITNKTKSKKNKKAVIAVVEQKPVIKAVKSEDSKDVVIKTDSKKDKKGKTFTLEEQKLVLKPGKGKPSKIDSTIASKHEKAGKNQPKKEKESKAEVVDKKTQKQKKEILKSKGVTPLEDFIKVEQDADSDSSADFDSDEFERVLGDDSDDDNVETDNDDIESDSNDVESDDDDEESVNEDVENEDDALDDSNESNNTESDESEDEVPKKKNSKVMPKVAPRMNAIIGIQKKGPQIQGKRKAAQKTAPAPVPKKPKFEKQANQKQRNKQFKKKK